MDTPEDQLVMIRPGFLRHAPYVQVSEAVALYRRFGREIWDHVSTHYPGLTALVG